MMFWRDSGGSTRPGPLRAAGYLAACGVLLVVLAAVLVTRASAQPPERVSAAHAALAGTPAQDAPGGKAIFDEKCTGCHTIGGGHLVGPDLKDVTKRRDPQWIKTFLQDPPAMLASDPTAQQLLKENNNVAMPNMGLTADQIDQLLAYLGNPGAVSSAPAIAPGAGNPAVGRQLFTGELGLTNGGPHCLACHTVSGAGYLGGGGLGPDLTHVVQRLGEPGLAGALKTIAYPTMMGPFKNRALTPAEQADLVAFLKESNQWQPPVAVITPGALSTNAALVFTIGLVTAGVLFGLLAFFWARIKKTTTLRLPTRKV